MTKSPKPETIEQTVLFLMLQNPMICDADILAEVKKKYPNCKTSLKCMRYYRSKFRKYYTFIPDSYDVRRPTLRLVA
jgi:hypothetical protein